MNEICIEHCAPQRDCSAFEPKPNLKLSDMPRFPLHEKASMTKEEKFTSVTIYLAKVVDHLQGNEEIVPLITHRSSRLNINTEIGGLAASFQDLQNEPTKESGKRPHEIFSSESNANKEQE